MVTRECSTNTRKNQGASESATAITQAAGADRLRRGQLPWCAPRLTSVRRGAVQPLWRPATGRVLRLWRTERYRLKGIFCSIDYIRKEIPESYNQSLSRTRTIYTTSKAQPADGFLKSHRPRHRDPL